MVYRKMTARARMTIHCAESDYWDAVRKWPRAGRTTLITRQFKDVYDRGRQVPHCTSWAVINDILIGQIPDRLRKY